MSNFDFLKDFDETLYKLGNRIEKQVNISPSGVKADATPFLEHILTRLLSHIGKKYNPHKSFYSQLDEVYRAGKISYGYKQKIYGAYQLRNKLHDNLEEIEKDEYYVASQLHERLFYIAKKFYRDFNENYDEYKGVPSYKPIELDTTDDEIELIKIPDFPEIIDVNYDYCIICGEPNHSNYSLYCSECNRVIDNANNYISIRNSFGKDAKFKKEDLIEYGIPEGYVNQMISHLVREDMLRVKGIFITFNSMHFDKYMNKISGYLSVGELITKFREDKITPAEIKRTKEYKQGSFRQDPFYQFYKIVNSEIISKFEREILTSASIQNSMEYTTITQKELQRWYRMNLANYRRGNVNESFVEFNRLLQDDYMELKRQGILEKQIKKDLNVTDEIYEFWIKTNKSFEDEIIQIKKDLILNALSEGKTREEAISVSGVTPKEYDDIVKVADFRKDEFSLERNRELETRKANFIEHIKYNDVATSCAMAKIEVEDFYEWYEKDLTSEFYLETTRILMHNFLSQRRKGKTRVESAAAIGLPCNFVEHWFKRTLDICESFKNDHIVVVVDLIYRGFKAGRTKREISKTADVSINRINSYLKLGQRGYGTYKRLYDYYEAEIIPVELDRFLAELTNKPIKKALEISELSSEELDECCASVRSGNNTYKDFYDRFYITRLNVFLDNIDKGKDKSKAVRNANLSMKELEECYELGRNGDERFTDFYGKYHEIKFRTFLDSIIKGKTESQALKSAELKREDLPDNLDEMIFERKFNIVVGSLKNDFTTKQAAKKANVSIDTVFEWFLKGRDGDEHFKEFYDMYLDGYVEPGSRIVQRLLNEDIPLHLILKRNRKNFTREDYDFWMREGYMQKAQEYLENEDDEDDEEVEKLKREIMNRI